VESSSRVLAGDTCWPDAELEAAKIVNEIRPQYKNVLDCI
jgi:hypothetical protein